MTDYSKMTDDELNEAIAIKKGWSRYIHHDENGLWDEWYTPRHKPSIYNQIPKHTHDWRLAGELLEEMPGSVELGRCIRGWYCMLRYSLVFAQTPQRAICEAWLEWKSS